jgi:hypothetical protein
MKTGSRFYARRLFRQVVAPIVLTIIACANAGVLAKPAAAAGMQYYVSTSGNDTKPGTLAQLFRTIAKGASILQPGDTLNLRQGIYVETVDIAAKHGTATQPIVIRSYPGEHAYIDGSLPQFRVLNNTDWEPASRYDPKALRDEFVSKEAFSQGVTNEDKVVNRGAFLDRNPYTRLITYANLNDFRANNETFEKIQDTNYDDSQRPGPKVMESCERDDPDPNCHLYPDGNRYRLAPYRHPWVYMGPGIWFNRHPNTPTTGKVHIRLSHTHNNISGLADYRGEVDPTKVKLAITAKDMTTLHVRGSSNLHFQNLSVRYGGQYSIQLTNVAGLVFDHVRISAATYGVRMGEEATTNTIFRHCEFNGGLPTWYFRSDRKDEYDYDDGGTIVHNKLGKQTAHALLLGNPNNTDTEIHHCEFVNGHDVYLIGQKVRFHHNWVHNLNDEGLFVDAVGKESTIFLDMKIYQNVIVKTLSAISFAGAHEEGMWQIYRNLIDLRSPTAGFRPRRPGDQDVWRYGHLIKSNQPDGPYALFQNTFLVYGQDEQASFMHYRNTTETHARRSFNNIFVAVNPDATSDHAITFIPSPSFQGPTDGNNYYRMGAATAKPYRYLGYTYNGVTYPGRYFDNLAALRDSTLFQQSKSQYTPGYEANSIESSPQFRRIHTDGVFRVTDDLRLGDTSPAIGAGVSLPNDLRDLDPFAPISIRPDIGAYPNGADALQVGVDGRRAYPSQ